MNIIATIYKDDYTFNFYTDYMCQVATEDDENHKQVYLGITTDSCSGEFISCPRCPLYYQCKDAAVAVVLARLKPDIVPAYPEFFI